MRHLPRFYFDLHNDVDVPDSEGKELPGLEAARENALIEAREMIAASVGRGQLDLNHFIEVRDYPGNVVHRLNFGDAVKVIPER